MSSHPDLAPRPTVAELPSLLAAFRAAATRLRPEQELVKLLVKLTGGFAEIRASWGHVVASAGRRGDETQSFKLVHAGRHVGQLAVDFPAPWQALAPVAAEYALLARLQSAAAGAARRRVGERTLDALLDGRGQQNALGDEPFALALATLVRQPARGASAQAAHAHALDVLAGAGEGYFAERHLHGFCTVRGGAAVWLWPTQHLATEAAELYQALSASTGQDLQLGVSGLHSALTSAAQTGSEVAAAFAEAEQALETLQKTGVALFTALDPLHSLLQSEALFALRQQVLGQLARLADSGKVEATLRAFLTHSGTLEELAAQQRIHVNTLRYRLKLAERAVNGSLSDPATCTRLYLALMPSRALQEPHGASGD